MDGTDGDCRGNSDIHDNHQHIDDDNHDHDDDDDDDDDYDDYGNVETNPDVERDSG